ncbi:uncharacterized protein LOC133022099 [Limanda limanda]|uniref:uncharacterized protein LOC133022099 n=1 Tax=Limanda limanda TaxID=27771 RepID=UPI0029C83B04|nr:uncharacterized protein LOC133022099 [Limanda limanda]
MPYSCVSRVIAGVTTGRQLYGSSQPYGPVDPSLCLILVELAERNEIPISSFAHQEVEMPGSTIKTCISCMQHISVACKICKLCGAKQPMKKAVQKAKEKADKQWGARLKKGGNTSKLIDAGRILVHKFKMAGLHPILLFGTNKKNCVSCDFLTGLEVVKDKESASVKAVRELYESLLSVIVKREKTKALTPADPEGPRELAESPPHPAAKEEAEEEREEEEKTFTLLLTPCDTQSNGLVKESNSNSSEPGTSNNPHGAGSTKVRCLTCEKKEGNIGLDSLSQGVVMCYCDKRAPSSYQRNGDAFSLTAETTFYPTDDSTAAGPSVSSSVSKSPCAPTRLPVKRRVFRDELEESPSKRQANGQTFTTTETSSDSDFCNMDLFAPLESDIDESANSVTEQQSSDLTPPAMVVKCPQVVKEEEEEEEEEGKKDEGSSPDRNTAGPSVPQQSSTGSPPSADQSKPLSPPGSPPCTSSSISKAPPETICVSSPPHPVAPPSDPEPSIDSQSFWKSCNATGCTQAIFTDFINEMNDIAGRIQSDQASEDDCNHALKVMAASGKLEEIVAKQQKALQRKQQELMKAAATMQQFMSALSR